MKINNRLIKNLGNGVRMKLDPVVIESVQSENVQSTDLKKEHNLSETATTRVGISVLEATSFDKKTPQRVNKAFSLNDNKLQKKSAALVQNGFLLSCELSPYELATFLAGNAEGRIKIM